MKLCLLALSLLCASDVFAQSREVVVQSRTVVPIQTRLRFTTMLALPEGEEILDFVCGDKDYWVISGASNLAYVKPAKSGASTNLNLVTVSGRVYSFLLTEGVGEPDLNVYVKLDAPAAGRAETSSFVPASRAESLGRDLERTRHDLEVERSSRAAAIEQAIGEYRASYPLRLRFPYRFQAGTKPFYLAAIFHDGAFTYIQTAARELPSLYELRDGKANLVHFQVQHGFFIVPKVLDRAYLAIGKQKLTFESTER
jgi:type IV secretory pathway VirB9-like protein